MRKHVSSKNGEMGQISRSGLSIFHSTSGDEVGTEQKHGGGAVLSPWAYREHSQW